MVGTAGFSVVYKPFWTHLFAAPAVLHSIYTHGAEHLLSPANTKATIGCLYKIISQLLWMFVSVYENSMGGSPVSLFPRVIKCLTSA